MRLVERVGLPVVLLAIAVLAAAIVTVVVSLHQMADEVNRIEAKLTVRSVEAAVASTLRRLGDINHDYAAWDDAVRNLYGTVNTGFVDENVVPSTESAILFDSAFLIGSEGEDIFGFHAGKAAGMSAAEAFGHSLAGMLARLPSDGKTYDVVTGVVSGALGLSAVAIGPVTPNTLEFENGPTEARFLLLGKSIDDAMLARLGQDYQIENLRLGPANAEPGLGLVDPDGTVIGRLTWMSRQLGDVAHANVSMVPLVMLGLVALMMGLLIAIALRSLQELQQREGEARHAATHDGLTGLPNRRAMVVALDEAIAKADRDGQGVAVVYLDLDGFKAVNDAYGHDTGDRVIHLVAGSLAGVGGDRMLSRVGGDEFVLSVVGANAATVAYDLAWKLVEAVTAPFSIEGRVIVIGASAGVAAVDRERLSGEELLRRADVAMYQAKQQGRGRVFVYDPVIDTVRHERLALAADLRNALDRDELQLVYQPVFDAQSRHIVAVEALVRWHLPRLGDVPPAVFVEIAEEVGLIDRLGAWTLRRACIDSRAWPSIRVAVNVSPAQFRNPGFGSQTVAILDETGFPAERLDLEVTESYFVVRPEQARRTIESVREIGISVVLDDFGTGYSSIGYLKSFTFDKLKLDRSMIAGIESEESVQRFVQATVALADALGLAVTAEGVETEAEAILLRLAGCDYLQGFHLARPRPAPDTADLVMADAARASVLAQS